MISCQVFKVCKVCKVHKVCNIRFTSSISIKRISGKGLAQTYNRPNIQIEISLITGINSNVASLPETFSLSQNYPNPFNPNTVISYSLIANHFTTLKVYDVLGKEVIVLVNEKQNAGSYSIDFNASNLASGVYFYRIESGEFVGVKRMLLVK